MRMQGKNVFITQANDYMGPAISELFSAEGADVITREGVVPTDDSFQDYIENRKNEVVIWRCDI